MVSDEIRGRQWPTSCRNLTSLDLILSVMESHRRVLRIRALQSDLCSWNITLAVVGELEGKF